MATDDWSNPGPLDAAWGYMGVVAKSASWITERVKLVWPRSTAGGN
jgi:hypothetical protein